MIRNKGNTLYLYEGDTGTIEVEITGDIRPGDELEFRIKENMEDENCVFSERDDDIQDGKFTININPATTQLLHPDGEDDKTYFYGFKLYREGQVIDTLVPKEKLIIQKGV